MQKLEEKMYSGRPKTDTFLKKILKDSLPSWIGYILDILAGHY